MVQLVFQGKTMIQGIEERIVAAEKEVQAAEAKIESLKEEHEKPVRRGIGQEQIAVTEGTFTYVAVGADRRPCAVPPEN